MRSLQTGEEDGYKPMGGATMVARGPEFSMRYSCTDSFRVQILSVAILVAAVTTVLVALVSEAVPPAATAALDSVQ